MRSSLVNRSTFSNGRKLAVAVPLFSKNARAVGRLQVRAEDANDPQAKEDMIERLERRSGARSNFKQGGGTNNLNRKMSDLERRNQERREAAGAYFASPQLDASQQATNAPKPPKKVGPFGIDLQLDEFKEPEGFDEMSDLAKAWTRWSSTGGVLDFMNKSATLLCIVVAFAWVVFRFVGPLLGVYELEASFADGPNIGI